MKIRTLIPVLLSVFCTIAIAKKVPPDVRNFQQPDLIFPNACKSSELRKLKNKVFETASKNDPALAWSLINEMLCGDTLQSYNYVIAHTAPTIIREGYDIDENGNALRKEVSGNSIQLVRMEAWDANIVEVDGVIRVLFADGGVCAWSFDIKKEAPATWQIVAIGIACD